MALWDLAGRRTGTPLWMLLGGARDRVPIYNTLPEFVRDLEVERLRVGDASIHLRFDRTADGGVTTGVRRIDGRLDVVIESGT